MLTFISLKDAKDIKQEGYSGVFWGVCMWGADFIGNLRRVAFGWLSSWVCLPLYKAELPLVPTHVWSVRKPGSPWTLKIIFDESWSMLTNDWRINNCKAEDSRRAADRWHFMSPDIGCIFRFEVGKLNCLRYFSYYKNVHSCKHYIYSLGETLSKYTVTVFYILLIRFFYDSSISLWDNYSCLKIVFDTGLPISVIMIDSHFVCFCLVWFKRALLLQWPFSALWG